MSNICNQEVRYAIEEITAYHFEDMIETGQGIGSSDISICLNEVEDFFKGKVSSSKILDIMLETILKIENELKNA